MVYSQYHIPPSGLPFRARILFLCLYYNHCVCSSRIFLHKDFPSYPLPFQTVCRYTKNKHCLCYNSVITERCLVWRIRDPDNNSPVGDTLQIDKVE